MFNLYIKIILVTFTFLMSHTALSQSLDGLKGVVSSHQEKILRIEDKIKDLIGLIEQQSNKSTNDFDSNEIKIQVRSLNETIKLIKSNITNVTNLVFNLDFSLKRIERYLELSSINNIDNNKSENNNLENKPSYKKKEKIKINKNNLTPKTIGILGFVKENPDQNKNITLTQEKKKIERDLNSTLPKGSADDQYNFALDAALKGDFSKAENAFKEFLKVHKGNKKQADAQYWLGRVYYTQKKYEEAAIALAEFNSIFPNDARFQETTLLIAEAAVNFAPKIQLCEILSQSLEFMINPSEKFKTRILFLKNEKQCPSE